MTRPLSRQDLVITRMGPDGPIPYDLLLLADETREAIDRYVHTSAVYTVEHAGYAGPVAAFVLKVEGGTVELMNIAVLDELRSLGIGSLLIAHIRHDALHEGRTVLRVGCADAGFSELRFYLRNGFRVTGVRKDFYTHHYPAPILADGIQLRDMLVLECPLR